MIAVFQFGAVLTENEMGSGVCRWLWNWRLNLFRILEFFRLTFNAYSS